MTIICFSFVIWFVVACCDALLSVNLHFFVSSFCLLVFLQNLNSTGTYGKPVPGTDSIFGLVITVSN